MTNFINCITENNSSLFKEKVLKNFDEKNVDSLILCNMCYYECKANVLRVFLKVVVNGFLINYKIEFKLKNKFFDRFNSLDNPITNKEMNEFLILQILKINKNSVLNKKYFKGSSFLIK